MVESSWAEKKLPALLRRLLKNYKDGRGINHVEGHDLPNIETVRLCLRRLFRLVFPGFIDGHPVTNVNLPYHIGEQLAHVLTELTPEVERAFRYDCRVQNCDHCDVGARAEEAITHLLDSLPQIRDTLKQDIQAAYDGDPAAKSFDSIIVCYPCVEAITTYRLAHELYLMNVPLIPRMWSELAHSNTGIDINPGATIGPRFFIDHGTGVVIGETTVIGKGVAIYQGVTLGALAPGKGQSLRGVKRHPTIEDNVIIYAGATILGGETVIGEGAVVGGNVWLTESVPPGTKVVLPKSDLVFLHPGKIKELRKVSKGEFEPARPEPACECAAAKSKSIDCTQCKSAEK
jgi:serine O-acetyltransferase